jgi:pyridoxal phosphate enzyme (YggS family)
MESSMTDIAKNFEIIKERVDASAKKTRRNRSDITIVAVSKTVGADAVGQAVEAGIRDFGENYVKEYLKKREVLPDTLRWHIIGPLQSNKIKLILDGICLLHSLDRLSLAQEIEKQCEKNGTELSALVQLNIGKEPTKSGILEEDLERFLNDVSVMRRIRLKGLMAIPPAAIKADANRPYFEKMRTLFDRYKREYAEFEYLSMGMSDDFEAAIEEGSNVVRIGTAVFGARSN